MKKRLVSITTAICVVLAALVAIAFAVSVNAETKVTSLSFTINNYYVDGGVDNVTVVQNDNVGALSWNTAYAGSSAISTAGDSFENFVNNALVDKQGITLKESTDYYLGLYMIVSSGYDVSELTAANVKVNCGSSDSKFF